MNPPSTNDPNAMLVIPARLGSVALLARLLQRLEQQPQCVAPEQYRAVAQRLAQVLADVPTDDESQRALRALMDAMPVLAEVYENLHYERAGLCCAPLVAAARAEVAARAAIARAAAAR
jgi:hypothetical protein